MIDPIVSVITPTFNHEKYIAECIESVINQSFSNWEMIIVNDGSTDNTQAIIDTYCSKDKRIKSIQQPNKGLYKLNESYNKALEISKGQYIAILEGDDYWKADKLQIQVDNMIKNKAIFCWSFAEARDDNKKLLELYPTNYDISKTDVYNNKKPALILNMMYEDFPIPLTWLIDKSVLNQMGGFKQSDNSPMLDRDTIYNLSLYGDFVFVPEILGIYRRQLEQATSKSMIEITDACGRIFKDFCSSLPTDIRKNVKFTDKEITTLNNNKMLLCHSRFGRFLLRKKQFELAKKHYLISILHSGSIEMTIWRLRSLIGLIFSFFKMDIENLAKFLGKKNYN